MPLQVIFHGLASSAPICNSVTAIVVKIRVEVRVRQLPGEKAL